MEAVGLFGPCRELQPCRSRDREWRPSAVLRGGERDPSSPSSAPMNSNVMPFDTPNNGPVIVAGRASPSPSMVWGTELQPVSWQIPSGLGNDAIHYCPPVRPVVLRATAERLWRHGRILRTAAVRQPDSDCGAHARPLSAGRTRELHGGSAGLLGRRL